MIQNFEEFLNESKLNESLHPDFDKLGFYDMSNGYMPGLIEALDKEGVKYDYDEYTNFLVIEDGSANISKIVDYITNEDFGNGAKLDYNEWPEDLESPVDDCVLLRLPAPNVPPGAMM